MANYNMPSPWFQIKRLFEKQWPEISVESRFVGHSGRWGRVQDEER
jgi:hypothetical protein